VVGTGGGDSEAMFAATVASSKTATTIMIGGNPVVVRAEASCIQRIRALSKIDGMSAEEMCLEAAIGKAKAQAVTSATKITFAASAKVDACGFECASKVRDQIGQMDDAASVMTKHAVEGIFALSSVPTYDICTQKIKRKFDESISPLSEAKKCGCLKLTEFGKDMNNPDKDNEMNRFFAAQFMKASGELDKLNSEIADDLKDVKSLGLMGAKPACDLQKVDGCEPTFLQNLRFDKLGMPVSDDIINDLKFILIEKLRDGEPSKDTRAAKFKATGFLSYLEKNGSSITDLKRNYEMISPPLSYELFIADYFETKIPNIAREKCLRIKEKIGGSCKRHQDWRPPKLPDDTQPHLVQESMMRKYDDFINSPEGKAFNKLITLEGTKAVAAPSQDDKIRKMIEKANLPNLSAAEKDTALTLPRKMSNLAQNLPPELQLGSRPEFIDNYRCLLLGMKIQTSGPAAACLKKTSIDDNCTNVLFELIGGDIGTSSDATDRASYVEILKFISGVGMDQGDYSLSPRLGAFIENAAAASGGMGVEDPTASPVSSLGGNGGGGMTPDDDGGWYGGSSYDGGSSAPYQSIGRTSQSEGVSAKSPTTDEVAVPKNETTAPLQQQSSQPQNGQAAFKPTYLPSVEEQKLQNIEKQLDKQEKEVATNIAAVSKVVADPETSAADKAQYQQMLDELQKEREGLAQMRQELEDQKKVVASKAKKKTAKKKSSSEDDGSEVDEEESTDDNGAAGGATVSTTASKKQRAGKTSTQNTTKLPAGQGTQAASTVPTAPGALPADIGAGAGSNSSSGGSVQGVSSGSSQGMDSQGGMNQAILRSMGIGSDSSPGSVDRISPDRLATVTAQRVVVEYPDGREVLLKRKPGATGNGAEAYEEVTDPVEVAKYVKKKPADPPAKANQPTKLAIPPSMKDVQESIQRYKDLQKQLRQVTQK